MSGIVDGTSRLWVMRIDRGALDIHGSRTRVEAIDHLVRCEMVGDHSEDSKARVRAAVERALGHMDERAPSAPDDDCCGDNVNRSSDPSVAIATVIQPSDPCPQCGQAIRVKELSEGGGVVCSAGCGYWFCY